MQNRFFLLLTIPVPGLLLWLAVPAGAQTVHTLSYDAPQGCANRSEFIAAIESRGGHLTADDTKTLQVSIQLQGNEFVGSLQVNNSGMSSAARKVKGGDCREVVNALAVVAASELRPATDSTPKSRPIPETQAHTQEVMPPSANSPQGFRGKSTWGNDALEVTAGTLRFRPLLSWTVTGGIAVGQVPKLIIPRYDIVFRLANFVTTPDGAQRLNGPILRARVGLLGPPFPTYEAGDAKTTFGGGQTMGLGVCWSPHYDTQGLLLLGCVEFGYGIMGFSTKEANGSLAKTENYGFGNVGPILSEHDFERSLVDSAQTDSSPKNVQLVWASFSSALTGAVNHLEPVSGLHRVETGQKAENPQRTELAHAARSSFGKAPVWVLVGAVGGSALTAALLLSTGHSVESFSHRQLSLPEASVPISIQPIHPMASNPDPTSTSMSGSGTSLSAASRQVPVPVAAAKLRERAARPDLHSDWRQAGVPAGSAETQARVAASERVESTLAAEVDQLDAARTAYRAGAYQEAISLVEIYHRRFPRGVLAPDAEVVAIQSLCEQKNRLGAAKRATRFLEMYPKDPHAGLVRQWAEPTPKTATSDP